MPSSARSTPASRAPATAKTLNVDPGSNVSRTARLRSGAPERGAFGLKVGALARASTSPVRGSIATSMPAAAHRAGELAPVERAPGRERPHRGRLGGGDAALQPGELSAAGEPRVEGGGVEA